jgi:hypothetical protein
MHTYPRHCLYLIASISLLFVLNNLSIASAHKTHPFGDYEDVMEDARRVLEACAIKDESPNAERYLNIILSEQVVSDDKKYSFEAAVRRVLKFEPTFSFNETDQAYFNFLSKLPATEMIIFSNFYKAFTTRPAADGLKEPPLPPIMYIYEYLNRVAKHDDEKMVCAKSLFNKALRWRLPTGPLPNTKVSFVRGDKYIYMISLQTDE